MSELKPCPLCGGEPFLGGYDVVWCQKCSAEAHVDDWNRRPDAPSAGEWMPIETAPKDGTFILMGGMTKGKSVNIGRWGEGRYLGRTKGFDITWVTMPGYGVNPTHWMPLPAPPQADGAQG